MVQYPQWIHTLHLGVRSLLPVKPPEIDTLVFEGVMKLFQVFAEELLVGTFEGDWLYFSHIRKGKKGDEQLLWMSPVRAPYTWLRMVSRKPAHRQPGVY
jgi:hypothetical protein